MKVFCEYNQEYDAFLKKAVQYTLDRYESRLELSNLEEIELIDKGKIKIETDGRTCCSGKKIVVTSRLYELLPSYNISDIEDDANFKLIINTLYHEMGHVTDWIHMPIMYNTVCNSPKTEGGISALVWIEYLAEKRSNDERTDDYDELCEGFAKSKWRAYKSDINSAGSDNFSYLVKTIPYRRWIEYVEKRNRRSGRRRGYQRTDTNSVDLVEYARGLASKQVNMIQLLTYYSIGKWIVDVQQKGEERAKYGQRVIASLADGMTAVYGRGFSKSNLENARKFYLTYKDRITQTVFRQFAIEKTQQEEIYLSDRNQIIQKKQLEHSNAVYNEYLKQQKEMRSLVICKGTEQLRSLRNRYVVGITDRPACVGCRADGERNPGI